MASIFSHIKNVYLSMSPPIPAPSENDREPLRMGILGAVNIAPNAVIVPSKSSTGLKVTSIAARDSKRAEEFAKSHGIAKVYGGRVDVVYNPLPNGLHLKWTTEAVKNSKDVLCEKPLASNTQQAREMCAVAREHNRVVLEAFHYRFHPSLHVFAYHLRKARTPENPLVGVKASMMVPDGFIKDSDIRFSYPLAGGALMDCGVYPISTVLYAVRVAGEGARAGSDFDFAAWSSGIEVVNADSVLFSTSDTKVLEAKANLNAEASQQSMKPQAQNCWFQFLVVLRDRKCHTPAWWEGPKLSLPTVDATLKDGTKIELVNYIAPSIYHCITVTSPSGQQQYYKAYTPSQNSSTDLGVTAAVDGKWESTVGKLWSEFERKFIFVAPLPLPSHAGTTYRYTIEAFDLGVQAFKRGTAPVLVAPPSSADDAKKRKGGWAPVWMDNRKSEVIMECVDKIYEKSGLGKPS
ncbi:NAD(P)-binding protein [Gonapodya prolifera JEL478]|uniref:D-xylose 1-dehydrogenase (NADP(+), D-xylono-1,5-lactone-forming) n=1 Tax=Gonapodya prolifera (strain JEL478) TaxID=1344416 RepID=A0A139ABK3_GONPJ|nr:NAD(P)-binding protein [Gonapodya prolifera JEL478]|eukprot:KXS14212.1 NAD(P)-binding protein [Gonapodya prolifera JEL478]